MTDQLITLETARLAQEKGFNLDVHNYYDSEDQINFVIGALDFNHFEDNISAPTQSLLQRWLRERESPIVLTINFSFIDDSESAFTWNIKEYVHEGVEGSRKKDEWDFWKVYDSFVSLGGDWFKTHEEALEKGLLRALKLINK